MTDERRGDYIHLSEQHTELAKAISGVDNKVNDVVRALEVHVAEGHESYVARYEIEGWMERSEDFHERILKNQESLATVVLGELKEGYDGDRYREGGLADIVRRLNNGGSIRITIPRWLSASIIAFMGTVIAAIIMANGGG